MIISSCPTRISFSSMDHSPFAERFTGVALNACINKRVYIIIRKRNPIEQFKYRISYSKTELCNNIEEIEHPLVRESIKYAQIEDPLEIIYSADVPAKSGLASSSSMTAALVKGLYYYRNIAISPEILFDAVYTIERIKCNQSGGFQDGVVCYSGINYLTGRPYYVKRTPINLSLDKLDELKDNILLLYVGNGVESHYVLSEQIQKLKKGETLEESFKIKRLVEEMYTIFTEKDFNPIQLSFPIREAWELKKTLSSSITNANIEQAENYILKECPNAGLRLIGGGGRGLLMVIDKKENLDKIRNVTDLKELEFNWDLEGCKVRRIEG